MDTRMCEQISSDQKEICISVYCPSDSVFTASVTKKTTSARSGAPQGAFFSDLTGSTGSAGGHPTISSYNLIDFRYDPWRREVT